MPRNLFWTWFVDFRMPILLFFLQKTLRTREKLGVLEGLVELIISEKRGAYYCNSISFHENVQILTETAANCRLVWPTLCFLCRPSQARFGGRMTGIFCLLLVPVSEDWHVERIFQARKGQWNSEIGIKMRLTGTGWFWVVDQFPENSSEWRFQRTSTTSSEASAEFQKKRHKKADVGCNQNPVQCNDM